MFFNIKARNSNFTRYYNDPVETVTENSIVLSFQFSGSRPVEMWQEIADRGNLLSLVVEIENVPADGNTWLYYQLELLLV